MTMKEAIYERHSVRQFKDEEISKEHKEKLESLIAEANDESGLSMDYDLLCRQLEEFIKEDSFYIPVLSNASALLFETLPNLNWAGFYLIRDNRLVLGPFQGKSACIHIEKGKGVCGSAWESDKVLVVPDVHEFPGHIACDSQSESEIVIPLHKNDEVFGVLDIDSPLKDRFSEKDKEGLESFAKILERQMRMRT